jgi:hypothetical protein
MEIAKGHREIDWERFDFEKRILPPASLVLEKALIRITPEGQIIYRPDVEEPLVVNRAKQPINLKGIEQEEYEDHLLYAADRIQRTTIRLLSPIHRKHAYHWLSNLAYEISAYAYDPDFLKKAAKWAELRITEKGLIISPWRQYQGDHISPEE